MSINPERIAALVQGLSEAEAEARIAGYHRGWDHANYVEAYGGAPKDEPSESDVPERFKALETDHWFTSGWAEGAEDFNNDSE